MVGPEKVQESKLKSEKEVTADQTQSKAGAPQDPQPPPQAAKAEKEEERDFVITKRFSMPMGISFVSFERGQVVDDPMILKRIREAFPDKAPLRPLHALDLVG